MYDTILHGDCLELLRTLPANSVQTCVTSPPYWKQRDYGVLGQLGRERTPEDYVANLVAVFHEMRRVLRPDGTFWLNIADTYDEGDLVGLPWRVAFALKSDGWMLRNDAIWHKTSCMPEDVSDRLARNHEYVFLFTPARRYFFDAAAIREESAPSSIARAKYNGRHPSPKSITGARTGVYCGPVSTKKAYGQGRNKQTILSIAPQPYHGAHFAVMPPKLAEVCILAGSRAGDIVLDPFFGSGTVGVVARRHSRHYLGIEINAAYIEMAVTRIANERQPVLWSA